MKKLFLISAAFMTMLMSYANKVEPRRIYIPKLNSGKVHHSPYNGASITSYYDAQSSLLTIISHSKQNDVEITITKDGEEVVHNVFDMGTNEGLEYDFTESESGEYTLYVTSRTDILFIESFIVF